MEHLHTWYGDPHALGASRDALLLVTTSPSAQLGRQLWEALRQRHLWSWVPLGYGRSWGKAFSIIIYIQIYKPTSHSQRVT